MTMRQACRGCRHCRGTPARSAARPLHRRIDPLQGPQHAVGITPPPDLVLAFDAVEDGPFDDLRVRTHELQAEVRA